MKAALVRQSAHGRPTQPTRRQRQPRRPLPPATRTRPTRTRRTTARRPLRAERPRARPLSFPALHPPALLFRRFPPPAPGPRSLVTRGLAWTLRHFLVLQGGAHCCQRSRGRSDKVMGWETGREGGDYRYSSAVEADGSSGAGRALAVLLVGDGDWMTCTQGGFGRTKSATRPLAEARARRATGRAGQGHAPSLPEAFLKPVRMPSEIFSVVDALTEWPERDASWLTPLSSASCRGRVGGGRRQDGKGSRGSEKRKGKGSTHAVRAARGAGAGRRAVAGRRALDLGGDVLEGVHVCSRRARGDGEGRGACQDRQAGEAARRRRRPNGVRPTTTPRRAMQQHKAHGWG